MSAANQFIVEISTEVCNQIGGIHTVLTSKMPTMVKHYGNNYFLIGPYLPKEYSGIFLPFGESGYDDVIGKTVLMLRDAGVRVHYGKWLTRGEPRVVLLDPFTPLADAARIKGRFFNAHGLEEAGPGWIDATINCGLLVEMFFSAFARVCPETFSIIAHFHGALCAYALPAITAEDHRVKTVYTAHSTILGELLASRDPLFYDRLDAYDWKTEVSNFNSDIRFVAVLEKLAGTNANVFTTVSEITAQECECLLQRKPDVITLNGLDLEEIASKGEALLTGNAARERVERICGDHLSLTGRNQENVFYFFTAGRYEYRNKGFDLILESLALLNEQLETENKDVVVVMIIITSAPERINDPVNAAAISPGRDSGEEPWPEVLIGEHGDAAHSALMHDCKRLNLNNHPASRVKVLYHPQFLTRTRSPFHLDYKEFIRGCHLGIFPSAYEPWGYTVTECLAHGVMAVASDTAGVSAYFEQTAVDHKPAGFYQVKRRNLPVAESKSSLAQLLMDFIQKPLPEASAVSKSVSMLDWNRVFSHYVEAYNLAEKA